MSKLDSIDWIPITALSLLDMTYACHVGLSHSIDNFFHLKLEFFGPFSSQPLVTLGGLGFSFFSSLSSCGCALAELRGSTQNYCTYIKNILNLT